MEKELFCSDAHDGTDLIVEDDGDPKTLWVRVGDSLGSGVTRIGAADAVKLAGVLTAWAAGKRSGLVEYVETQSGHSIRQMWKDLGV